LQSKAWKKKSVGHNKKDCAEEKAKRGFICISDEAKADTDRTFRNDVIGSFISDSGPAALLRDPVSGRYFDVLSDANVYFFPSEAAAEEIGLSKDILDQMRAEKML